MRNLNLDDELFILIRKIVKNALKLFICMFSQSFLFKTYIYIYITVDNGETRNVRMGSSFVLYNLYMRKILH